MIADDVRDRVRHLHRRMGVIRDKIISRDVARGRGERVVDITLAAHDMTWLFRRRLELRSIDGRVVARIGSEIPGDLQLLPALLRRPRIGGDDGNAAQWVEARWNRRCGNFHHLHHARDFQRLRGIEGDNFAAIDWAAFDRRVLHARQHDVDAVGRLAADHVIEIDDRNRLADVTAFARRLEPQIHMIVRRHLQRGGDLGHIAERQLPSGRDMDHHMIAGAAIFGVDVPHVRRRGFEHRPRRGTGDTHRLIELPHAARAVGVLIAVFRIALRLNDFDARPVRLEFVGENHRQRGANPGAHFRTVGDDRHQSGLVDGEIDIGIETCRRRRRRSRFGEREWTRSDMESQHQAGQAADALDDIAPA